MKKIKFPLVMKNGAAVRSIGELRENFDMESVVEHFATGKLMQWLESNYYDDALNSIQELTGEEKDFGERMAKSLGVAWDNTTEINFTRVLKETKLKEQIKPYVSEEKMSEITYIADTQDEMEHLARKGCTPIYLFGKQFMIQDWMEEVECIGINNPLVSIQSESKEEFRKKKIKLSNVIFPDDETKKIASDNPMLNSYSDLLEAMDLYLNKVHEILKREEK